MRALTALACIALLPGCAPKGGKGKGKKGEDVVKTCVLATNQANSLQGKWDVTPIKVSMHAGDFVGDEVNEFQKGGTTWNNFFNKVGRGSPIFDMGPAGTGNLSTAIQAAPSCNSSLLADGTVIYKRVSNFTKSATAIAVTSTCFRVNTEALATITNAIMEFNFVNFFTDASGKFPDMESIAVHELGHLLGLDHACGPLGAPNQADPNVACPDVNANPGDELVQSVMFPQVFFDAGGNGEEKRNLNSNDQGRANCLYPTTQ